VNSRDRSLALQRLDELVHGNRCALAGFVAEDQAGKLASEVGMKADIVERAEIPGLDCPPFVRAQRIAIEHGGFMGGELRAQFDGPFQVLDQVVDRERRVEFFQSHERAP